MSSHPIEFLLYIRRELAEISSNTTLKVAPTRTPDLFIIKTIFLKQGLMSIQSLFLVVILVFGPPDLRPS